MNKRIVGSIALAAAGIMTVAACSSSHSSTTGSSSTSTSNGETMVSGALGYIPAATGTPHAGTISWGQVTGQTPNEIFPVVDSADNAVFNTESFEWNFWRPLYWTQEGTKAQMDPQLSIAEPPVYSNNDKTVSITMKTSYKWSNGQPITANDVAFFIDLCKAAISESPADWEGYVPGNFPSNLVSMSEPNPETLVLNLSGSVNPSFFTLDMLGYGPIQAIPSAVWAKTSASGSIIPESQWNAPGAAGLKVDKAIYNYLGAPTGSQGADLSTYATNPLWQVVDGPYKISAFNPSSGNWSMVPNPNYGGPHASVEDTISAVTFTSLDAELNAVKAGQLDVAQIEQSAVPQLPQIKREGYQYFFIPDFGSNSANFNFQDKTGDFGAIANQVYFRQAMEHLENEPGWISAFMFGAGAPAYDSVGTAPASPYTPADATTAPFPYSISAAESLLKSHGWTINSGGTDVCSSAGTGPSDCGAGIPAGTKLAFPFFYNTGTPLIGQQAQSLAESAKQAGIEISLSGMTFNTILQKYYDPNGPSQYNTWAMTDFGGNTNDPYPTTFGLLNINGGENTGDLVNTTINGLIQQSVYGSNPDAVENELSWVATNVPLLWQPNPDYGWAWKDDISSTDPDALESLTQYYMQPEFWYINN
jgi:peptide/nickel transport system substrate-binding protein